MSGGLLVITAHPDDEVLIAGGTLAACAQNRLGTAVVCLTRGESGPIADARLATRATLGEVREHELRDACAELGVGLVKCFRREDGGLEWSDHSRIAGQLARIIDQWQPEVVISFGEDGLYHHSDHIATFELAGKAVRRAEHSAALYRSIWVKNEMRELCSELRRRGLSQDLWGLELADFGVEDDERDAEVVVDVRHLVDRKLRALYHHRTQLESGHALLTLPPDLARRFLGFERFAPVEACGASPPKLFHRLSGRAAHV